MRHIQRTAVIDSYPYPVAVQKLDPEVVLRRPVRRHFRDGLEPLIAAAVRLVVGMGITSPSHGNGHVLTPLRGYDDAAVLLPPPGCLTIPFRGRDVGPPAGSSIAIGDRKSCDSICRVVQPTHACRVRLAFGFH